MSSNFVVIAPSILDDEELTAAPIPEHWVLEGRPAARAKGLASSADGLSNAALWDCTAGRFEWRFGADETVHILEGSVIVTCPSGETTTLETGDVAFFPAGITSVWEVPHYVKKLAVLREQRTLSRRARALARKIPLALVIARNRRGATHAAQAHGTITG